MKSATVSLTREEARFRIDSAEVGDYVLDDGYKPYLHPLRTIGGRTLSLAMPSDHRHHKGLMYALTATDVNWWEEVAVDGYVDTPGVQRIEVTEQTGEAEIAQQLIWTDADGRRATFRERRVISCSWQEAGFVRWTWSADFDVLRDTELRQSIWSEEHHGRMVNYHGLGIRFPREFGFDPSAGRWQSDGQLGADAIIGTTSESVTVTDLVDGEVPAPQVSLRITQPGSAHGWFATQSPGFGWLSVGPTVLPERRRMSTGDVFHEEYFVDVADGNPFATER
nr:DUF6807 family protein [Frigoribacterium faeni]